MKLFMIMQLTICSRALTPISGLDGNVATQLKG